MRRCGRCRSSLILDFSPDATDPDPIWKCLGCGRETFVDVARQAEDERLRHGITAAGPARMSSLAATRVQ